VSGKTKLGLIRQTLTEINPWWRTADWESTDHDLQAARGSGLDYEAHALDGLESGGLYVLRGPRRVGKTVSAKQAISRLIAAGVPPLSIVRLAADGSSAGDIRTAVQNTPLPDPPLGHRWWFIDEITGATGDWALTVKWLRDNIQHFAEATVVVTGSNAEALTAAKGTWPGRRGQVDDADRTLLPIGFRTWTDRVIKAAPDGLPRLGLSDLRTIVGRDAFGAASVWLDTLVRAWDLYLVYGGFPVAAAAAKRGEPIPDWFLTDIFNVIYNDVFAESRASETTASHMVERLWAGIGSPANLANIASDLDVDGKTVARHLGYLRNGYLAWDCPQGHERRWAPRPGALAKIYAIDPLVARLAHLRNPGRDDVDPTLLSEMMIGMAVRRAAVAAGRRWEGDNLLFHLRTPARKEIDFVSELLGGTALEGKFVDDDAWHSEARTVEASPWSGILATRSVLDTSSTDGAWAVPAGILAYLIDT
jgi:predicted AAA+ superfamily ATPase